MSFERAKVNCDRCYDLSRKLRLRTDLSDEEKFLYTNQISLARNNAMDAVEKAMDRGNLSDVAKSMLSYCMDCNRENKPGISNGVCNLR